MNYWRMNTDRAARSDIRTCDLWYVLGMAMAGDFEGNRDKHSGIFAELQPGHGVFMHHSGFGIVGYGIVKERWDKNAYQGTDRLLYRKEVYEYRIPVDWQPNCDCRNKPVPIGGRLPYAGAFSRVDPSLWKVQVILDELIRRRNEANQ